LAPCAARIVERMGVEQHLHFVLQAPQALRGALARGETWLDPVEITGLLEAYDIPCAPARLARTMVAPSPSVAEVR
jgi:hypothetical protein